MRNVISNSCLNSWTAWIFAGVLVPPALELRHCTFLRMPPHNVTLHSLLIAPLHESMVYSILEVTFISTHIFGGTAFSFSASSVQSKCSIVFLPLANNTRIGYMKLEFSLA